jgi:hypothetical protein
MDIAQNTLYEMIEEMVAHNLIQTTCIFEERHHSRCHDAGKLTAKE